MSKAASGWARTSNRGRRSAGGVSRRPERGGGERYHEGNGLRQISPRRAGSGGRSSAASLPRRPLVGHGVLVEQLAAFRSLRRRVSSASTMVTARR